MKEAIRYYLGMILWIMPTLLGAALVPVLFRPANPFNYMVVGVISGVILFVLLMPASEKRKLGIFRKLKRVIKRGLRNEYMERGTNCGPPHF